MYSLDIFEFFERVEGALLWHEYEADVYLNNQAWYTANLMMATGNMRKGTDALKLKKGLYESLEDIAEQSQEKVQKNVEDEKAKLIEIFNIDASKIK